MPSLRLALVILLLGGCGDGKIGASAASVMTVIDGAADTHQGAP